MTIQQLKDNKWLLFESISGSHAYGTNIATSDTDIKGVFVLPKKHFYGLDYVEQVNDERNDEVYYELTRFVELLAKNNPNMLEMLAMPKDCILFSHPLFEAFTPELFLSKRCKQTFAGYAFAQVKKARGLNKKIVNPIAKERKTVLDFCHVINGYGTMSLTKWLKKKGFQQEHCGLVNIPHMKDIYALFHNKDINYKGIIKKQYSNDISLSSIPKSEQHETLLSFNKNGYSTYCKSYREYWAWVENRNEARYATTVSHGKNYDSKNIMHTFRLLDIAEEIAKYGELRVRSTNRDFLLSIRRGEFEYDDLVKKAELRLTKIDELYAKSKLPESPNLEKINQLLIDTRMAWYELSEK